MTAALSRTVRLSAAEWDHWYQTGYPTLVSHKETERFYTHVAPKPGMTAVDLACGSGQWTRQLTAWGLTVRGYDFSPEALRQANAAGMRDGLTYARWDIDGDPIPRTLRPGTVDLVTCRYALPYLAYARLLTDVGRWLTGTGTFYALVRVDDKGTTDEDQTANDEQHARDPFHRGLTEDQIETLGYGWAYGETYSLSARHRAIVLRGYGNTMPCSEAGRRRGHQTPGAGGDPPSPESYAPAPGPYGHGDPAQAEDPPPDRAAHACAIG
ncbi:class I SAM-dependent methyltransferase (plasmid) [Streptomyces sp. NBC_01384]|uniref:class I SAM-dependent methyltransferase n=1 Tax=Streptomyces sp. NBC_01384 TaxID=2903847 RepID=UPI002F91A6CA